MDFLSRTVNFFSNIVSFHSKWYGEKLNLWIKHFVVILYFATSIYTCRLETVSVYSLKDMGPTLSTEFKSWLMNQVARVIFWILIVLIIFFLNGWGIILSQSYYFVFWWKCHHSYQPVTVQCWIINFIKYHSYDVELSTLLSTTQIMLNYHLY